VADLVAQSQTLGGAQQSTSTEPMELVRAEDLLAVSGFTPTAIDQLRDYVIVLPSSGTNINVNTAPAEVVAALVPGLSLSDAAAMVNTRKTVYYRQKADFTGTAQMSGKTILTPWDVRSDYFLAYSRVRLDRATLETQSLLVRTRTSPTRVEWIREY
jgi:general secretion pathway protein K